MEILYTILTIFCLVFGFYTGYKIGKEQILPKVPKQILHPIETRKEKKEEKEQDKKLEELQNVLEEIDNYNADIM